MKYYTFGATFEKSVIGHYPQYKNCDFPILYDHSLQAQLIKLDNNYADYPIEPFNFIIHNRAKFTDIVDLGALSSAGGIIISEKFKECLAGFLLPEKHRFNEINVQNQKGIVKYYWLRFHVDLFPFIDVEQTEFKFINENDKTIKEFNVASREELTSYRNQQKFGITLRDKRIVFKRDFPNYAVFDDNIGRLSRVMITEPLLNHLLENKITGLSYLELKHWEKL